MKLLTVAIPCYNSQDYMRHAVETVLIGGEDVEILLVDDGSKDKTAEIADELEKEYPTIIRAIHQKNGGHGSAVNAGLSGIFFKGSGFTSRFREGGAWRGYAPDKLCV